MFASEPGRPCPPRPCRGSTAVVAQRTPSGVLGPLASLCSNWLKQPEESRRFPQQEWTAPAPQSEVGRIKTQKREVPHVISLSQSPPPRVALPSRDFLAGMNYVSQVASCKQRRRDSCALASGGRLFSSWVSGSTGGHNLKATVTSHLFTGPKLFADIHYSISHKFYLIASILIFTTLEYKVHISGSKSAGQRGLYTQIPVATNHFTPLPQYPRTSNSRDGGGWVG